MTERNKGVLLIFLAALLWSTGGVFIKATSLNAFQTSLWRSLFASLAILLIVRPKTLLLDATSLIASLAYAATLILFVLGTKLTTAANAILLQYTAPIYILVLAHFILNEKMTRIGVMTVALCITGMAIFFLDKLSPEGVVGNLAALGSGVCFAVDDRVSAQKQRWRTHQRNSLRQHLDCHHLCGDFIFSSLFARCVCALAQRRTTHGLSRRVSNRASLSAFRQCD
jgi:drug/metabolite transporter (DMT)-like permease